MNRFVLLFVVTSLMSFAANRSDLFKEVPLFIKGLKHIDVYAVYETLDARYTPKWMFWKEKKAMIKRGLAISAAEILQGFFDSEGYYEANVSVEMSERNVTIFIDEGKPVRVADIVVKSDYDLSDLITFEKGEVFRAEKFVEIKRNIIDALLNDGYCSYDLDTKAYVDLERYRVDLRYLLKKGEPCVFGNATVRGLETIDERIVLSRVRAKPGRRFSKELVQQTSTAIYGLDSFDSVAINVNRKFYNVVPVDIKVQEMQKPYHIEIGAGYDTYVGARVHALLHKHNFMGNAQQLRIKLAWSQMESLAVAEFFKPLLFEALGYPIDFGASGGYSNLEFDGFHEEKVFMKGYLRYQGERFDVTAGLSAESIDISKRDDGENLLPEYAYDTFDLTYPYVKVVYDARDSKLNPKKGYYLLGYAEYGFPMRNASSRYIKLEAEARYIYTFSSSLTAAIVGKAGTIEIYRNSAGGIPESKKFFGGGSYSNRAYGYRELGVITSPTRDTINGALSMANLSLELDYPIMGKLYGAVFTDNTMLNAESYDFTGDIITSVGVGVRYMTPVGPFKLDVGFNVHDPSQYGIIFQIGQSF